MSNIVESLPANWYHDEDIFLQEQKKIFKTNWIYITHSGELENPGQFITSTISGQSIVIVHTQSGELKGYLNLCRHRASMLCWESHGTVPQFTCPYHSWSYDLTGHLKNAPGFDLDNDLDAKDYGLIEIRVDTWNGLVFACLDENIIGLNDWLGEVVTIADRFPSTSEMTFETVRTNNCDANWKNYSDNAAEGYHLPSIHPRLNIAMDSKKTEIKAYENGNFVGFDVRYKDDKGGSPGFWIYKFPGLLIHFSDTDFNIERIIPLSTGQCTIQRWFWFLPSVDANERAEILDFSTQVMEEDMGVCARVQKNLEGGVYKTGVLSKQREPGTIFFQSLVKQALVTNYSD